MRKPTDGRPSDDRCVVKVLLVAFKAFFDGTTRKLRLETERLAKATAAGRKLASAISYAEECSLKSFSQAA